MSDKKMGRPTEGAKRTHTLYFPDELWTAIGKVKGTKTITAFIVDHLYSIPEVAAYLARHSKKGEK